MPQDSPPHPASLQRRKIGFQYHRPARLDMKALHRKQPPYESAAPAYCFFFVGFRSTPLARPLSIIRSIEQSTYTGALASVWRNVSCACITHAGAADHINSVNQHSKVLTRALLHANNRIGIASGLTHGRGFHELSDQFVCYWGLSRPAISPHAPGTSSISADVGARLLGARIVKSFR